MPVCSWTIKDHEPAWAYTVGPWDDGYQGVRGGQPVLGPREPPERRRQVG